MSTVFNVDTQGNLLTVGTVRHSILNSAGVVHTNSIGTLSTSLIVTADIAQNTIDNNNLKTMSPHTFKGNNLDMFSSPIDLTIAQMQTELSVPPVIAQTITFQMTGSVTPTFDFPVTFVKVGRLVTMQWNGFQRKTTNQSDFLFTGDVVPTQFLPSYPAGNPLAWNITVVSGLTEFSYVTGSLSFGPLGNIQIGSSVGGGNFTSTWCGALGSSISYIVN
jgi:hypothetical protein